MEQRYNKVCTLEAKMRHNTVKLFQQVVTQVWDVDRYLLLKAFKIARLPAWKSVTYTETTDLMSGLLYCAHGNALPLKVGIRSFPALFSMNIGNLSLVLHLSGTGLISKQAWG